MRRLAIVFTAGVLAAQQKAAAPALSAEEVGAFQALVQEQRVAQAELRAAQERLDRLQEMGVRLTMQACQDRGITAASFGELVKVCEVSFEKRTVVRKASEPVKGK